MSTVAEIKAAITQLSLEERAELIADLCGWPDDEWDLQMKRDAALRKFAKMNAQAEADYASGNSVPLADGIENEN